MKRFKIKNILYFSLCFGTVFLAGTSCTKDFEEVNKPWKEAQTADVNSLFNGVLSSLELTWNEQSIANSFIYPITQLGTIVGSSGYRMEAASNDLWKDYYEALFTIKFLEKTINESPNPETLTNVKSMLAIIKAYKTFKMTDIFGDMPYSEAARANEGSAYYSVKFDSQKDIYIALLNDLKEAVNGLSTASTQVSLGTSETLLGNNIAMWRKFGNSLRLRYAMRMQDIEPALATTHVQEALALPLLEDMEHVGVSPAAQSYTGESREWSFSANCYLRMGTTAWNLMSNSNATNGSGIFDQRAKIFFETNYNDQWVAKEQNVSVTEGGDPYNYTIRDADWTMKGTGNGISNFNFYFGRDKNIPDLLITAAEVYFLKAEAAVKGLGRAASLVDAKANYESGVRSSVNFWTTMARTSPVWVVNKPTALPTATELLWITANPKVAFTTALSTDAALRLIYAQRWIDNFRQPYEAWALQRQTDRTPRSTVSDNLYVGLFGNYFRLNYADNEFQYNAANTVSATGGKDALQWMATKVWWDVN
ncbi:SusD/RagB family nutrient-binding outer membrane lipoprotein [Sphingobacterium bambusae]|uniref:SusD/RagB family nutrient-binding outer membrane lipoprotein n=1 Tax=Sphingobacterium bambusae TaxID=662858 RepID=A0ABW6BGN0_9SPHI|nr:SusD/RagB family nutrient-binding outer membrane lipoprotein [Sphingobacterium bambusae]WPL50447.1 SusD/RagB family nutrient-binding outer membrane lipoprotein [Sphingobacterium bambusae]